MVLEDCRFALQLLEQETDLQRWRITWIAAVALIRAVGHVLHKADGRNMEIRVAASNLFTEWKNHREENEIFFEFIEKERNNILKEYEVNVHPLDGVEVVVQSTLRSLETGELRIEAFVANLDENVYRPLLDSYREGDDARDVYAEAIDWWEEQLEKIDNAVVR